MGWSVAYVLIHGQSLKHYSTEEYKICVKVKGIINYHKNYTKRSLKEYWLLKFSKQTLPVTENIGTTVSTGVNKGKGRLTLWIEDYCIMVAKLSDEVIEFGVRV